MQSTTGSESKSLSVSTPVPAKRYQSVDFLRGLTVMFMIIVNTPGTWDYVYKPLQHANWHGCTPTDVIFPCFLVIIGISMWFSFGKYNHRFSLEAGKKIIRRTILMFVIGMLLNKFPVFWKNLDHWHIMGVLQRIALAYGLASVLALTLSRRALLGTSAGILLLYWGILNWFATPGSDPYGMEANVLLQFDGWLYGLEVDAMTGLEHLLYGSKHVFLRKGFHFVTMGVLSTLPTIVTVLIGWFCGQAMEKYSGDKYLLLRQLLLAGVVCCFTGLAWDLVMPINKKLWTSSYVLYTGGISLIALAASVWLIDIKKWNTGTGFFYTFGSNPLFAFVLSEGIAQILCTIEWMEGDVHREANWWIYKTVFRPIEGAEFGSLLFALCFMLFCWLICRWLYIRKIYVKI